MYSEIKDKKGRTLMHINAQGKVALTRFKDLSDEEIDKIAEIYHAVTQNDIEEAKKFLRFEGDEKFCS